MRFIRFHGVGNYRNEGGRENRGERGESVRDCLSLIHIYFIKDKVNAEFEVVEKIYSFTKVLCCRKQFLNFNIINKFDITSLAETV